jgi:outer membrane cobalamin receptor
MRRRNDYLLEAPMRPIALWLLASPVLGCGPAAQRSGAAVSPNSYFITADKIAQSGARTAWDALRLTVPNVQFRESRGRPAKITRRGRASIYLDDQTRLIIDNVRVYDIRVLEQMAASDISTIEVLSGLDATTYYGGTSTSGMIVIRTKTGPTP